MDKDTITLQEAGNDGKSVFLYYDAMAGVYLAFGLSAYYTTMVTDPYMSYSEDMQNASGSAAQEPYQFVATELAEGRAYGETVLSVPAAPDCRRGWVC